MKNIIIILLMAFCYTQAEKCIPCADDAQQAHDAFRAVVPSAAIGLGSALLLVGLNHVLGTDKHISDGWFIVLPLAFSFYELGNGTYHTAKFGIDLSHNL